MRKILLIGLVALMIMLVGCTPEPVVDNSYSVGVSQDLYNCPARGITMPCDSVTKWGVENGQCNNALLGNKRCNSGNGWEFVEENPPVEPEPKPSGDALPKQDTAGKEMICYPEPKEYCVPKG